LVSRSIKKDETPAVPIFRTAKVSFQNISKTALDTARYFYELTNHVTPQGGANYSPLLADSIACGTQNRQDFFGKKAKISF
jgi:hypothetical protein